MALRTVGVRLTAEVSAYMANMKRAGGATRELVGEMDKAARAGHLDAVADRAGAVGIGLAGIAAGAVKMAADFDKAMSGVRAATHASTKEIDQLREAALQAGKDSQYSATEAAGAITELSKAGVATADILNGGLKGALDLADNVLDFQVALAVDQSPADGQILEFGLAADDDEILYNFPGDDDGLGNIAASTWANPASRLLYLRISTVVQGDRTDPTFAGAVIDRVEDHDYTAAASVFNTGNYTKIRKRLLQTIVEVRNLP